MQTTLREAKAKLSELVELASSGEEILITVHGRPKARLVPTRPAEDLDSFEAWAGVLREKAATYTVKQTDSSRDILRELREDRG